MFDRLGAALSRALTKGEGRSSDRDAPVDSAALKAEADARLKAGELAEAARLYQRAVARDPMNGRAHFALGYVLIETGNAPEAIGHLRTALDHRRRDERRALSARIDPCGQGQQSRPASIAHFDAAIALGSTNAFVYRDCCMALLQLDRAGGSEGGDHQKGWR